MEMSDFKVRIKDMQVSSIQDGAPSTKIPRSTLKFEWKRYYVMPFSFIPITCGGTISSEVWGV
jgi:hypothetical protein